MPIPPIHQGEQIHFCQYIKTGVSEVGMVRAEKKNKRVCVGVKLYGTISDVCRWVVQGRPGVYIQQPIPFPCVDASTGTIYSHLQQQQKPYVRLEVIPRVLQWVYHPSLTLGKRKMPWKPLKEGWNS